MPFPVKFVSSNNREGFTIVPFLLYSSYRILFLAKPQFAFKNVFLNYLVRSLFSVTFILQSVDAYFSDDLSLKLCQNVLKCC